MTNEWWKKWLMRFQYKINVDIFTSLFYCFLVYIQILISNKIIHDVSKCGNINILYSQIIYICIKINFTLILYVYEMI